jgi:predicted RNA-binding protein Jag
MKQVRDHLQKLLELTGLREPVVDSDAEGKRLNAFVNEDEWIKEWLPRLVNDLSHIARLISVKAGFAEMVYVDVNNYRRERERLIIDLAKAAAHKVLMTKSDVILPAMNAYERRLVHTELATRPDVKTESRGEKKDRCVVVKPLL